MAPAIRRSLPIHPDIPDSVRSSSAYPKPPIVAVVAEPVQTGERYDGFASTWIAASSACVCPHEQIRTMKKLKQGHNIDKVTDWLVPKLHTQITLARRDEMSTIYTK